MNNSAVYHIVFVDSAHASSCVSFQLDCKVCLQLINSSNFITHLQPDDSRTKSPAVPAHRAGKASPAPRTPQVC